MKSIRDWQLHDFQRILRALVRFSLNNREELGLLGKVERVEPGAAPKKEEAPATGGAGVPPKP